jgi:CubicO group peptidase (beta-lactamase class C family)
MTATCAGGAGSQDDPDRSSATDAAHERPVFPDPEWATADPESQGFNPQLLDTLAAEAHAGGASSLLVAREGRIVAEWYWNGTDESTRHQVNSITKSYTSTLMGIAQDEGLLDIDDPASTYIPEWEGTPSETVTIRQMLGMVSGREAIAVVKPEFLNEYFGAPDMTAYALDRRQVAPPGEVWALNEGDIQPLDAILEAVTGMQPAAYAADRLLGPLGDDRTTMATDAAGNTIMDALAQATCRDVARLGHLYLQRGDWNGRQVVSETWVEDATGEPSQDIFPGYGLLWWLNRAGQTQLNKVDQDSIGDVDPVQHQLAPGAPEDLFWAIGAFGQVLQVHPTTGTVVVRLGHGSDFLDIRPVAIAARLVTDALDDNR